MRSVGMRKKTELYLLKEDPSIARALKIYLCILML